ncbi:MAG: glycosyltransferase family 4 protein [Cyclobacteriaceae bacterium]|nr:glycosyltransferase family 4 protein [Cyclobacteriaceae bacterium]
MSKVMGVLTGFIKRVLTLFVVPRFDFIFIHREATPLGPPWFEWIASKIFRKKVIYDFDDAIWLTPTSKENSFAAKFRWQSKTESICTWSYSISCGNDYLASFAKQFNKRVIVNPTTIDVRNVHNPYLFPPKIKSDRLVIGWTGTHSTLTYLDMIVPVIQSLEKKLHNHFEFHVIADKNPNFALSSFRFIKWSKETEIQDLLQFDIGLMPLIDEIWAKGKCGFKALQYMAMDIPVIASPVGVNKDIIDEGVNGFLCQSLSQWEEKISQLINDCELRKRMGDAGRLKITNTYSLDSNSDNFLSLFE